MAEELYPRVTIGGKEYWRIETMTLVEVDPNGRTLFMVATPQGGIANTGPLVKGDPGPGTEIVDLDVAELAYDDPTPMSGTLVELSPASGIDPQRLKLELAIREGRPGADGTTSIDPATITGARTPGRLVALNPSANGFVYVPARIGGMHWPASITEAPPGTTATHVLSTIPVTSGVYGFDWRPHLNAGTEIIGSGPDVRVDIVARLNAADGPVIGRREGITGASDRLTLISGPDAGASDSINRVAAGAAATVYLMAEKQSGTATYSTRRTRFSMEAIAVP